jgi:hypothetical protein
MAVERLMVGLLGISIWAAQMHAADTPAIADFQKRVQSYLKVRNTAVSTVGSLKATDSPERIQQYQRDLGQAIRSARAGAKQGDIFTNAIAPEFHRAIRAALTAPGAEHVKKGLRDTEPSPSTPIAVNADYPMDQPVQSMPPSLLQQLPQLPRGLEYRFVGRTLIMRDVEANLIVDYLNEALPQR